MKIPIAKIKLAHTSRFVWCGRGRRRPYLMNVFPAFSTLSPLSPLHPSLSLYLSCLHSLFIHTLRSNRKQHNYDSETCALFFITNTPYTPNGSFLSGPRHSYAINVLDKIQTETDTVPTNAYIASPSSIDVSFLARAHTQFIFDFRNFVLLFRFLSRLRTFSIPKCSRRVCPFAVIMQWKKHTLKRQRPERKTTKRNTQE